MITPILPIFGGELPLDDVPIIILIFAYYEDVRHPTRVFLGRACVLCFNPFPTPGNPDFSRSGKTAAEFAQEPSQFARMAPGPSRRRGRPALPTPRIWLTAGALLAVACQGGGERPLETSAGLSLDPWGLAEPPTAAARASEPVIAQSAVGLIRTSGAVPRAPGG